MNKLKTEFDKVTIGFILNVLLGLAFEFVIRVTICYKGFLNLLYQFTVL